MGEFLLGSSVGAAIMMAVIVGVGLTPEVEFSEVKQAESVCKGSNWVSINLTEIKCADGAVYQLKRK